MGKIMDISGGKEGPAILQLHKWRPSEVQLLGNLSEFREGFISPSRELLLLLSYQNEALLLPLVKEQSSNSRDPENGCCEELENPNSIASSSAEFTGTRASLDLGESSLGASETTDVYLTNDSTEETNFSGCNGGSFVHDVNSLAWGVCGDACNQYEETSFRELLFVLGHNGVTVHAFRKSYRGSKLMSPLEEIDNAEGMWMDWGPPLDFSHNVEVLEDSRLPDEASGNASYQRRTNERRGRPSTPIEATEDDMSCVGAPKTWLRTFLTKVCTVKSDGHLHTRFPEVSSFPLSAEVISFSIFGDDFSTLELISHENLVLDEKESRVISVLDCERTERGSSHANLLSTSQTASASASASSDSVTCGIDRSYKILKVFFEQFILLSWFCL